MRKLASIIVMLVVLSMSFGCKKELPTVSDHTYYNYLTCTILRAQVAFYNQHIAGTTISAPDMEFEAPYGGTVHITGSVSTTSNGLTTVNLNYDMNNVKWIESFSNGSSGTVYMTGTLNEIGSFSDDYKSTTCTSDNLQMTGEMHYGTATRDADEYGRVSIVTTNDKYNGEVFGYVVNNN